MPNSSFEPVTETRSFAGKRACFFMKTNEPEVLRRNEFYRVDLKILEDLGFEVSIATSPFSIPSADIYFVWWWTWAFAPLLRAKLAGRPVVIVGTFDHVLSDGTFEAFPHRHPLHQSLIRWALKSADANVVCAEDQRELIARSFKVQNLNYSPHVLDTDLYRPSVNVRQPFFLTFCWMHGENPVRKCVATSIRAMAAARDRLPGYKLVIGGDKGDGYPALAALVEELNAGDFVEFRGKVSTEEKIELMQSCRAYVQPTLAEGFGVAILEAMSCGAPVIVSAVGGVREVVGDLGLHVDGMDPDGLADAMVRMATDPDLTETQSARVRQRAVELFGYDRRLRDIKRILHQSLAGA